MAAAAANRQHLIFRAKQTLLRHRRFSVLPEQLPRLVRDVCEWQGDVLGPRIALACRRFGKPNSAGAVKTFWNHCATRQRLEGFDGLISKADGDALVRTHCGKAPKTQRAARRLLQRRLAVLRAIGAAVDLGDCFRVQIPENESANDSVDLAILGTVATHKSPPSKANDSVENALLRQSSPQKPHSYLTKVSRRGLAGASAPRHNGRFCKKSLDQPPQLEPAADPPAPAILLGGEPSAPKLGQRGQPKPPRWLAEMNDRMTRMLRERELGKQKPYNQPEGPDLPQRSEGWLGARQRRAMAIA